MNATNDTKPVTCPHCGNPNPEAHDDGAVEGPREYHAECWAQASADMTSEQIRAAWDASPIPEQ